MKHFPKQLVSSKNPVKEQNLAFKRGTDECPDSLFSSGAAVLLLRDIAPLKHSGANWRVPKLIWKDTIICVWSKFTTMVNTWSHMFSLLSDPKGLCSWDSTGSLRPSEWMVQVHGKTSLYCFPMINQMLFLEIVDLSSFMQTPGVPSFTVGRWEHMSMVNSILSPFCGVPTVCLSVGSSTAECSVAVC